MTSMEFVEGKSFGTQSVDRISLNSIKTSRSGNLRDDAILWIANNALSILESYGISGLINLTDRDEGATHAWRVENVLKFDLRVVGAIWCVNNHLAFSDG